MKYIMMDKKEFMSLGRGSIITFIDDVKELKAIKDRVKIQGVKVLIQDVINILDEVDSNTVKVKERDYFDNTFLITYIIKSSGEERDFWIPMEVVISGNQEIPKLSTVTNDKLFEQWIELSQERMNWEEL